MISIYKYIICPYSELGVELVPLRSSQRTREHILRQEESRFNIQIRKGFFTVRDVKLWNRLPQELVLTISVLRIKKRQNYFLNVHNKTGY